MGKDTAKPHKNSINLRKAAAGRILLENPGISTKKALIAAGYSPATARKPAESGLGADRCIAEAAKADPKAELGYGYTQAVLAYNRKAEQMATDLDYLHRCRPGEVAKFMDVAGRALHGRQGEAGLPTVGELEDVEIYVKARAKLGRPVIDVTPDPVND